MPRSAEAPSDARVAASTPLRAASPLCNGLVVVPKLRCIPPAKLPAIPNAVLVRSRSSPIVRHAAAVAPKVPDVQVTCQPR
jgi:hypothetical protein